MWTIDFWFSIGSTYSYLSVMRLPELAARSRVIFRWRPFNVRAIMREMANVPFADKPVKAAYMWRDIERRSARYGLRPKVPAPYPLAELELANRVAIIGMQEGWGELYTKATYEAWFERGQPPGSEPNLSAALKIVGQDATTIIDFANSPAGINALTRATEEARALGIFGAPTFVVDGELFWGDDRLEDAIEWRFKASALQLASPYG